MLCTRFMPKANFQKLNTAFGRAKAKRKPDRTCAEMLASRAIFRPVAASVRGLATKVAVGGAGGALGSAVLAKIAGGGLGLGDIELKVMGADRLPAASGDVKSISGATNVSGLLGDAKYAILLSGEPAQFQAAGKALAPGAVAGVMGNTNALIVATAAGEDKVVTGITKVAQAEGEAVLASQVRLSARRGRGKGGEARFRGWGVAL
eukprot:scaffold1171_cov108-Isochrysis_galbana.AAC.4